MRAWLPVAISLTPLLLTTYAHAQDADPMPPAPTTPAPTPPPSPAPSPADTTVTPPAPPPPATEPAPPPPVVVPVPVVVAPPPPAPPPIVVAPPPPPPNVDPAVNTAAPPPPDAKRDATKSEANQGKDKSEKSSGRNFELIYANGEAGFAKLNMTAFSQSKLGLVNTSSSGPMLGVGAGVRLFILTVGARVRLEELSSFNLWDANVDVGLHIPISQFDAYLGIHGGYASVGSFDASTIGSSPTTTSSSSTSGAVGVHGFDAGFAVGLDYYIASFFSIGVDGTGDVLFLKRPPIAKPTGFSSLPQSDQDMINSNPLYANSGDSAGFGYALSAHAGLHFGL